MLTFKLTLYLSTAKDSESPELLERENVMANQHFGVGEELLDWNMLHYQSKRMIERAAPDAGV